MTTPWDYELQYKFTVDIYDDDAKLLSNFTQQNYLQYIIKKR